MLPIPVGISGSVAPGTQILANNLWFGGVLSRKSGISLSAKIHSRTEDNIKVLATTEIEKPISGHIKPEPLNEIFEKQICFIGHSCTWLPTAIKINKPEEILENGEKRIVFLGHSCTWLPQTSPSLLNNTSVNHSIVQDSDTNFINGQQEINNKVLGGVKTDNMIKKNKSISPKIDRKKLSERIEDTKSTKKLNFSKKTEPDKTTIKDNENLLSKVVNIMPSVREKTNSTIVKNFTSTVKESSSQKVTTNPAIPQEEVISNNESVKLMKYANLSVCRNEKADALASNSAEISSNSPKSDINRTAIEAQNDCAPKHIHKAVNNQPVKIIESTLVIDKVTKNLKIVPNKELSQSVKMETDSINKNKITIDESTSSVTNKTQYNEEKIKRVENSSDKKLDIPEVQAKTVPSSLPTKVLNDCSSSKPSTITLTKSSNVNDNLNPKKSEEIKKPSMSNISNATVKSNNSTNSEIKISQTYSQKIASEQKQNLLAPNNTIINGRLTKSNWIENVFKNQEKNSKLSSDSILIDVKPKENNLINAEHNINKLPSSSTKSYDNIKLEPANNKNKYKEDIATRNFDEFSTNTLDKPLKSEKSLVFMGHSCAWIPEDYGIIPSPETLLENIEVKDIKKLPKNSEKLDKQFQDISKVSGNVAKTKLKSHPKEKKLTNEKPDEKSIDLTSKKHIVFMGNSCTWVPESVRKVEKDNKVNQVKEIKQKCKKSENDSLIETTKELNNNKNKEMNINPKLSSLSDKANKNESYKTVSKNPTNEEVKKDMDIGIKASLAQVETKLDVNANSDQRFKSVDPIPEIKENIKIQTDDPIITIPATQPNIGYFIFQDLESPIIVNVSQTKNVDSNNLCNKETKHKNNTKINKIIDSVNTAATYSTTSTSASNEKSTKMKSPTSSTNASKNSGFILVEEVKKNIPKNIDNKHQKSKTESNARNLKGFSSKQQAAHNKMATEETKLINESKLVTSNDKIEKLNTVMYEKNSATRNVSKVVKEKVAKNQYNADNKMQFKKGSFVIEEVTKNMPKKDNRKDIIKKQKNDSIRTSATYSTTSEKSTQMKAPNTTNSSKNIGFVLVEEVTKNIPKNMTNMDITEKPYNDPVKTSATYSTTSEKSTAIKAPITTNSSKNMEFILVEEVTKNIPKNMNKKDIAQRPDIDPVKTSATYSTTSEKSTAIKAPNTTNSSKNMEFILVEEVTKNIPKNMNNKDITQKPDNDPVKTSATYSTTSEKSTPIKAANSTNSSKNMEFILVEEVTKNIPKNMNNKDITQKPDIDPVKTSATYSTTSEKSTQMEAPNSTNSSKNMEFILVEEVTKNIPKNMNKKDIARKPDIDPVKTSATYSTTSEKSTPIKAPNTTNSSKNMEFILVEEITKNIPKNVSKKDFIKKPDRDSVKTSTPSVSVEKQTQLRTPNTTDSPTNTGFILVDEMNKDIPKNINNKDILKKVDNESNINNLSKGISFKQMEILNKVGTKGELISSNDKIDKLNKIMSEKIDAAIAAEKLQLTGSKNVSSVENEKVSADIKMPLKDDHFAVMNDEVVLNKKIPSGSTFLKKESLEKHANKNTKQTVHEHIILSSMNQNALNTSFKKSVKSPIQVKSGKQNRDDNAKETMQDCGIDIQSTSSVESTEIKSLNSEHANNILSRHINNLNIFNPIAKNELEKPIESKSEEKSTKTTQSKGSQIVNKTDAFKKIDEEKTARSLDCKFNVDQANVLSKRTKNNSKKSGITETIILNDFTISPITEKKQIKTSPASLENKRNQTFSDPKLIITEADAEDNAIQMLKKYKTDNFNMYNSSVKEDLMKNVQKSNISPNIGTPKKTDVKILSTTIPINQTKKMKIDTNVGTLQKADVIPTESVSTAPINQTNQMRNDTSAPTSDKTRKKGARKGGKHAKNEKILLTLEQSNDFSAPIDKEEKGFILVRANELNNSDKQAVNSSVDNQKSSLESEVDKLNVMKKLQKHNFNSFNSSDLSTEVNIKNDERSKIRNQNDVLKAVEADKDPIVNPTGKILLIPSIQKPKTSPTYKVDTFKLWKSKKHHENEMKSESTKLFNSPTEIEVESKIIKEDQINNEKLKNIGTIAQNFEPHKTSESVTSSMNVIKAADNSEHTKVEGANKINRGSEKIETNNFKSKNASTAPNSYKTDSEEYKSSLLVDQIMKGSLESTASKLGVSKFNKDEKPCDIPDFNGTKKSNEFQSSTPKLSVQPSNLKLISSKHDKIIPPKENIILENESILKEETCKPKKTDENEMLMKSPLEKYYRVIDSKLEQLQNQLDIKSETKPVEDSMEHKQVENLANESTIKETRRKFQKILTSKKIMDENESFSDINTASKPISNSDTKNITDNEPTSTKKSYIPLSFSMSNPIENTKQHTTSNSVLDDATLNQYKTYFEESTTSAQTPKIESTKSKSTNFAQPESLFQQLKNMIKEDLFTIPKETEEQVKLKKEKKPIAKLSVESCTTQPSIESIVNPDTVLKQVKDMIKEDLLTIPDNEKTSSGKANELPLIRTQINDAKETKLKLVEKKPIERELGTVESDTILSFPQNAPQMAQTKDTILDKDTAISSSIVQPQIKPDTLLAQAKNTLINTTSLRSPTQLNPEKNMSPRKTFTKLQSKSDVVDSGPKTATSVNLKPLLDDSKPSPTKIKNMTGTLTAGTTSKSNIEIFNSLQKTKNEFIEALLAGGKDIPEKLSPKRTDNINKSTEMENTIKIESKPWGETVSHPLTLMDRFKIFFKDNNSSNNFTQSEKKIEEVKKATKTNDMKAKNDSINQLKNQSLSVETNVSSNSQSSERQNVILQSQTQKKEVNLVASEKNKLYLNKIKENEVKENLASKKIDSVESLNPEKSVNEVAKLKLSSSTDENNQFKRNIDPPVDVDTKDSSVLEKFSSYFKSESQQDELNSKSNDIEQNISLLDHLTNMNTEQIKYDNHIKLLAESKSKTSKEPKLSREAFQKLQENAEMVKVNVVKSSNDNVSNKTISESIEIKEHNNEKIQTNVKLVAVDKNSESARDDTDKFLDMLGINKSDNNTSSSKSDSDLKENTELKPTKLVSGKSSKPDKDSITLQKAVELTKSDPASLEQTAKSDNNLQAIKTKLQISDASLLQSFASQGQIIDSSAVKVKEMNHAESKNQKKQIHQLSESEKIVVEKSSPKKASEKNTLKATSETFSDDKNNSLINNSNLSDTELGFFRSQHTSPIKQTIKTTSKDEKYHIDISKELKSSTTAYEQDKKINSINKKSQENDSKDIKPILPKAAKEEQRSSGNHKDSSSTGGQSKSSVVNFMALQSKTSSEKEQPKLPDSSAGATIEMDRYNSLEATPFNKNEIIVKILHSLKLATIKKD